MQEKFQFWTQSRIPAAMEISSKNLIMAAVLKNLSFTKEKSAATKKLLISTLADRANGESRRRSILVTITGHSRDYLDFPNLSASLSF